MNFLKAGLHFADALTTVSSRYSLEVQTPMFGHGLEGVLKARSKDLWGIVNGINTDIWSPSKDPLIAERFSTNNLVDKRGNKKELEDLCNFSEQGKMLVGMVSRLVTHKGFDVLTEAMSGLMKMDINIVIVGQGEKKWQHALSLMAQRYPNLTVILEYTELWAHQVYAGADLFLMPSSFEPCGLSQMKAMRYGTVPLVHETGGLADTVMPWSREDFSGCGFVMENYCAEDLLSQMTLALSLYQDKDSWVTLMKNGMTKDFSWKSSSQKYLSLYAHLLKKSVA
jgi:starch synthase